MVCGVISYDLHQCFSSRNSISVSWSVGQYISKWKHDVFASKKNQPIYIYIYVGCVDWYMQIRWWHSAIKYIHTYGFVVPAFNMRTVCVNVRSRKRDFSGEKIHISMNQFRLAPVLSLSHLHSFSRSPLPSAFASVAFIVMPSTAAYQTRFITNTLERHTNTLVLLISRTRTEPNQTKLKPMMASSCLCFILI